MLPLEPVSVGCDRLGAIFFVQCPSAISTMCAVRREYPTCDISIICYPFLLSFYLFSVQSPEASFQVYGLSFLVQYSTMHGYFGHPCSICTRFYSRLNSSLFFASHFRQHASVRAFPRLPLIFGESIIQIIIVLGPIRSGLLLVCFR
jgi:hypothetical protein